MEEPSGISDRLQQGGIAVPSETMSTALRLLLEAFLYARDVKASDWAFAVEIEWLRDRGISLSDLR